MENREVVCITEKDFIIDWVNKNENVFEYNETNRSYFLWKIDYITDLKMIEVYRNIERRIINNEKLHSYIKPVGQRGFDDFIYFMTNGGKIHNHKDSCSEVDEYKNKHMVRFNVCIQLPERGGVPIYNGKLLQIKECCYNICKSTIEYHSTNTCYGNKKKIVISYGFLFDNVDIINNLSKEYLLRLNYPTFF